MKPMAHSIQASPAHAMRGATKSRAPHRIVSVLATLLGLGLGLNGLYMLTAPDNWYHRIPGVMLTGPMNQHFIRDIGCAYLTASIGMIWGLLRPTQAQGAALMGAAFLSMHACVHLYEVAAGLCGWATWWQSVPGVTVPALLALLLCAMSRVDRRA